MFKFASVLVMLIASIAIAAPPEVPPTITAPQDKVREIVVKVPEGKTLLYRTVGDKLAFTEVVSLSKGEKKFWLISETGGRSHIVWWLKDEDGSSVSDINKEIEPTPPTPPDVKPDEKPKPKPVTSFRVFLIFESEDKLTSAQRGIVYGRVVEDWLNANCTDGNKGWRRRDKDAPGESDVKMASLWSAVQPAITTVPAIAIEVNGKVEIIPLEATPAAMVAKLNSYRGK